MKKIPQYSYFYTTKQKLFIFSKPESSYVGVDILHLLPDNEKEDYITVEGSIYTHKQIERRNGIIFMRMKKRLISSSLNE